MLCIKMLCKVEKLDQELVQSKETLVLSRAQLMLFKVNMMSC
jgi:hypothetical protein